MVFIFLQANEIYKGAKEDENDDEELHAILVIEYGANDFGQQCFLVGNSWGKDCGKKATAGEIRGEEFVGANG